MSMLLVRPPPRNTVIITITEVVVNMSLRAGVAVLRMDRAKAMAPRSPAKNMTCCMFMVILLLLERVKLMR